MVSWLMLLNMKVFAFKNKLNYCLFLPAGSETAEAGRYFSI